MEKDCRARGLNREDAMDRARWRKLIGTLTLFVARGLLELFQAKLDSLVCKQPLRYFLYGSRTISSVICFICIIVVLNCWF